jgi:hypothetical protein
VNSSASEHQRTLERIVATLPVMHTWGTPPGLSLHEKTVLLHEPVDPLGG